MKASLPYLLLSLLPLLLLVGLPSSQSADPNAPHRHGGILSPYQPKAPSIELDATALTKLAKGLPVLRQINEGSSGGRGIVVQEVHAPVDVVIGRILDYKNYPKMVPNVAYCGNYEENKISKDEVELKTRFVLSMLGFKLEYFIRHTYWPSIATITWTLDYSRASDFDDSVGYWSVAPRDGSKGSSEWSRVYYSIDLRVPDWVPGFVVNILQSQALTQATAWVKTESEKVFKVQKAQAAKNAVAGAGQQVKVNATASSAPRAGLWADFVDLYGDMIDQEKLVQQEARRTKRREERRTKTEAKRGRKAAGAAASEEGKKAQACSGEPVAWDDSRQLLSMAWVTIVFYAICRAWSSDEERQLAAAAKKSHAGDVSTPDVSEDDDE